MDVVIQIAGSLCILAGFALAQWGLLSMKSVRYLALNFIGSTVLAIDALLSQQWGFLLLEGVWSIVSAWGLLVIAVGLHHRSQPRQSPAGVAPPSISN